MDDVRRRMWVLLSIVAFVAGFSLLGLHMVVEGLLFELWLTYVVYGIALGGVIGGVALSQRSESDDICGGSTCPATPEGERGVELYDDAQVNAIASDVLIGAGAGLFVLGAVLFFTSPVV